MKRKYVLSVLIISLSFQLFSQNEISVELFDCLLEFDDRDTIDYIMLITNENLDIDTIDVKKCVSFTFYDSDSARYFTMIMHSMPINIFDNIKEPIYIKTKNLEISDLTKEDKKDYYRLYTDEELNKAWGYDYRVDLNGKTPDEEYFFNFQRQFRKNLFRNNC